MNRIPDPNSLFADVPTERPIIVAVSGGSDSIALLLLASSWARAGNAELQVVTVDHGLRPEAAAEAAFVAGVSEGLDLPHITLAWDGIKPESGISEAARVARYRLLEEFAAETGAGTILVGHTANDQAETVLMRNRRGDEESQARGLSGIAREMMLPRGTRLFRPLLGMTRHELRTYLSDFHQSWIEDPSNMDRSYERVRIRQDIGEDANLVRNVCRFANLMGRHRKLVADEVAVRLSEHIVVSQGPVYTVPEAALEGAPEAVRVLLMQVIIAVAGGGEHLVSTPAVTNIFAAETNDRITLGHAVVEKRAGEFRFYRERRNLPAIIVGPGDSVLWDGRLLIENGSAMSYFCSAPTREQLKAMEETQGRKFPVRPRAALLSTPFLCGDGDDVTLPFVKGFELPARLELSLCVRAIEHFCPDHDFALLQFVKALRNRVENHHWRQY